MTNWRKLAIFSGLYWLVRIPFFSLGFGLDSDAWRIARAAMNWQTTGIYEMSRYPGYPLTELFTMLLFKIDGAMITNIFSAIWGFGICILIWKLVEMFSSDVRGFWAALALSLFPPFIAMTTETMDYAPSLFWALLSLWMLKSKRYPFYLSAISCGVAVGFRFSAALFIPVCVWMTLRRYNATKAILYAVISIAIAVVGYLPAITCIYEFPKIPFWKQWEFSHFPYYLFITFGVWFWSAIGVAAVLWRKSIIKSLKSAPEFIMIVILFVILFAKFPFDAGYLLPVLPLSMVALARASQKFWVIIMTALLLNGIVKVKIKGVELPQERIFINPKLSKGEWIDYYCERRWQMRILPEIVRWAQKQKEETVVLLSDAPSSLLMLPDSLFRPLSNDTRRICHIRGTKVTLVGIAIPREKLVDIAKGKKIVIMQDAVRNNIIAFQYNIIDALGEREFSYVSRREATKFFARY